MGFTATLKNKQQLPGGFIMEEYTWVMDGGTTTGTVTADSTIQPEIVSISDWSTSSDGDNDIEEARDAGANKLKIVSAANDTGTLTIIGRAA